MTKEPICANCEAPLSQHTLSTALVVDDNEKPVLTILRVCPNAVFVENVPEGLKP